MKTFPIFLIDLANRLCIVVGGSKEAEFKVRSLLDCEATVTVISPTLTAQMQSWAEEGLFTWLRRDFQPGDLRGAFLVIAERGDAETSQRIWEESEAQGALVNVTDDVQHCNFVSGSVTRQGPLTISISTSGTAPAFSVRLRERFQKEFGPEYAEFLEIMGSLRAPMAARYPSFGERRDRWYRLVDSDVLDLLRSGEREQARARIAEIAGEEVAGQIPEG